MTERSATTNERLITDLFSKYKTVENGTPELEIRFKDVNRDLFTSVYEGLLEASRTDKSFSPPTLECSVNVISENIYERGTRGKSDRTQYIRKIIFINGTATTDTYLTKARVADPVHFNDFVRYSVTLSQETTVNKFPTSSSALMRFKIRVSFDCAIGPVDLPMNVRFDLTMVKHGNIQQLAGAVKTIKNTLFKSTLTPHTILEVAGEVDNYEIEIEYIGGAEPSSVFLSSAKKLFAVANASYVTDMTYQEEIYEIAKHLYDDPSPFKNSTHRLKQLLNQAISLTKNTYYSEVFPPADYYLLIKADGVRCCISLHGSKCRVLRSDKLFEWEVAGAISEASESNVAYPHTIADAEYLETTTDVTLRIFDVILVEGQNIAKAGYKARREYLETAAKLITEALKGTEGAPTVVAAEPWKLASNDLEGGFRAVLDAKYDFDTDGCIITEPMSNYLNTRNYKWKPLDRNTIDFLAIKCPQKLLGVEPYVVKKGQELYLLFVGIRRQMREHLGLGFIPQYKTMFQDTGAYQPIQFSPSINPTAYLYWAEMVKTPIDGKIIELSRDSKADNWIFHRVRTDRDMEKGYYGNDFRTAEQTYVNYFDPFDMIDLWMPSGGYFNKAQIDPLDDIHFAPNKFKRFVISNLLKNNFLGAKWIVDLASGRGADLHRYQEIEVSHALFIDVDATAIAELIRRKFDYFNSKQRQAKSWIEDKTGGGPTFNYENLIIKDVKNMTVHTMVADLKSPADTLIAGIYQYGLNLGIVNGIVCNFALHYLCDTIEHLRNILSFCARLIKVDGVFGFTVMDGKAVFDLLKGLGTGQKWQSLEGETVKYAITKKYTGDKLLPTGQMISVLLPFTTETYDEPLCNVDTVIAEASKFGFALEVNSSMSAQIDKFNKLAPDLAKRLTDEDLKYIGLFRYVTLRMIKPKLGGGRK